MDGIRFTNYTVLTQNTCLFLSF